MPITSINFSTSQENVNKIGLRSWKKFGAEYEIEKGENLEDAKKALKDFVYASLKAQPETMPEEIIQTKEPDTPQSTEAKDVTDIMLCKTEDELKSFALMVKSSKSKALKSAFNQKSNELNNKKKIALP